MLLLQYTYTLDTIGDAATAFWDIARKYRVITFSGEMGAGKTTFISTLCALLRVREPVSSPTFALVNEYGFSMDGKEETIYHIDLYRVKNTEEAMNAGMEDCIDQAMTGSAFCFVEWPQKAPELFHGTYISVNIDVTGEESRSLTVRLMG